MESPSAKRHKSCRDELAITHNDTLTSICDWSRPDAVAIKYYKLNENIRQITYAQLEDMQSTTAQILQDTNSTQFVGIAADIPAYCLPGLMLGIMMVDRAFVCLPPASKEAQHICDTLNISHIFSSRNVDDLKIVKDFKIDGSQLFLLQRNYSIDSVKFDAFNKFPGKFAYAITTSGSTGIPKIVRVTHSSIVPNILDLKRILEASRSDTIAQLTPVTFDPSIVEFFLSLSCSCALLTVSQSFKNDSKMLLNALVESRVSILQSTPSVLLQRWSRKELRDSILRKKSNLRILLLGGETLPNMKILSEVREPGNETRIFDIYGITEVSCWSTIREINSDDHTRTLGENLSETILEVRDERGNIIEEGEGVLHIGSESRICVIDDEDIDRSIKPIFRDTGDIVKIEQTGSITLKGRRGRRVKRYGTKLYLSELENHVTELPFVENCYALFFEKNQSLHLYFTTFNKSSDDDEKLRYKNEVSSSIMQLSSIYYPDEIHHLNRFELTSHGKICTNYLKKHSDNLSRVSQAEKTVSKSSTDIFTKFWKSSLPSCEDSGFLDSGGSSVMALRIASELSDEVGFDFPELIGMLLVNKNFHVCQEYIAKQSYNNSKTAENSTEELPNADSKLKIGEEIAPKEEKPTINVSKNISSSNGIFAWQKCRGRSSFPSSMEIDKEGPRNRAPKIRLEHQYSLGKCVDASPTVFRYPGGPSYVTVGSHSGIICTAELSKKNPPDHWKITLPDRIEASVLVLDDFRGVVGSYDSYVYCLHLKTGEIFWKFKTDDSVKCTAVLCSRGKNVFFGSYDHYAYCVSSENGSEVWKIKVNNGSISATPCVHDDLNAVLFSLLDGTCVSLNQNSGEINWKQKLDYPIFSAPIVLKNGVAVFCDVTGKLSSFVASTGEKMWNVETNGAVFSYLLVHTDRTTKLQSLVFASKNRCIYKLKYSTTEESPTFQLKEDLGVPFFSTPWTNGEVIVVVGTNGELKLLDFISGKELSSFKLGGDAFSSPIIHDDFIVVGCRDNNLYVLSLYDSS